MTKTFSIINKYLSGIFWDAKFYENTLKLEFPIHFTPVTSFQSYLTRESGNTVYAVWWQEAKRRRFYS